MTRLLATLRREVRLQARYNLYAVSVFVVLVWGAVLTALPDTARPSAGLIVPAFLVANLIITTFYFMGALVLLERDEGMLVALVTTPLRETEYLLSKVVTLTSLALAESLLLVAIFFGLPPDVLWLLMGSAALGGIYTFVGFTTVVRYDSVNAWLMPSAVFVTLLSLPLLHHFGVTGRLFFYLHPVEPPRVLMQMAYAPASAWDLAYGCIGSLAWLGVAFAWAKHCFHRFAVRTAAT